MMDTISKHHSMTTPGTRVDSKTRKYYRREQKLRVVQETFAPGASVSVVARKHDVNANIVFAWRRQYKRGLLSPKHAGSTLLPILVRPEEEEPLAAPEPLPQVPAASSPTGHMEVHLSEGRWIHVSGSVNLDVLRAVIGELARA